MGAPQRLRGTEWAALVATETLLATARAETITTLATARAETITASSSRSASALKPPSAATLPVSVPRCSQNSEKVCESMPTRVPTVNERQHCHNEDKKVCELEERTQPKQVK